MYTLYPHQNDAINSIYRYFLEGNTGNPIVGMPTGTGKSLVIGEFVRRVMQEYPRNRVTCVTHVKELIKQNSERLVELWPQAPLGVYSAGLKRRDTLPPIVYGGIQSMVHRKHEFGHRDLILIDECHLLGPKDDTQYAEFIGTMRHINPYVKVIGFTATAYRLGQGLLTDGENPLFTDFCFDITGLEPFNKLIRDGYLSPPISKRTATKIDISGVKINKDGDYDEDELQEILDTPDINRQVCLEMREYGMNRHCWLIFTTGVKHSEHVAEILNYNGIPSCAVHSKMVGDKRDQAIKDYKQGRLRCLVNFNVLTTGFDHRPIDFIGMLRPTKSTGLWVQMLGRGTRPSPETHKLNCLTLDFARNTAELGPINDPVIPLPRGTKNMKPGVMPTKICDECGTYNHVNARVCEYCGAPFPERQSRLDKTASNLDLLRESPTEVKDALLEWFDVQRVSYTRLFATNKIYMQVSYICGIRIFNENIYLEGDSKFKTKSIKWWKERMGSEYAPPTVDEALKYASALATPTRIRVDLSVMPNKIVEVEGLHRMTVPSNAPIWWNGAAAK